jgi:RNA polymerase sigma-70 factor (ECF subfamily)
LAAIAAKDPSVADESDYREFAALVDRHGAALFGILRRLCRHEHDAEDAFQETAAREWRSIRTRPRLANPRGWLMTIGYRAFVDLRSRVKTAEVLADAPDWRIGSPAHEAERGEDASRVQAAVAELPDLLRETAVLHYSGGLTIAQMATAMGIPPGTAKSRLNAALAQLRRSLS